MTDKLAVPSDLGKVVLEAAKQKHKQRFQESALESVVVILDSITRAEGVIRDQQDYIDKANKQLAAIEDGKFKLGMHGQITFDDKELQ